MGFNRDDNRGSSFSRGGFNRGGDRGGFSRGRSSFGGGRGGFGGGDRSPREMFKTVCSNCGKECEVPFRPTNGKPVYCSDCFEKMGNGSRGDSRQPGRSDFRSVSPVSAPNNAQLEALNVKLDKIISLLEPKKVVVSEPASTKSSVEVKEVKEKKAPKVKKTVKKVIAEE